jgi:hypothetical protein
MFSMKYEFININEHEYLVLEATVTENLNPNIDATLTYHIKIR